MASNADGSGGPRPDATARWSNRLEGSSSPYLLQHAHNPVDWYPWGAEAFEAARSRRVPIFLSVGYSTCYWCHVMERESFESEATGALLSERFVCIKVDREERPDVDDIYMNAVQLMTESGGWPMSVWLTPPGARSGDDKGLEAFYAGTYFPPSPAFGRPSFKQVIEGISEAWTTRREQVLEQAQQVTAAIRANLAAEYEPVRVDEAQIGQALGQLLRMHDDEHGGFGRAPKFPQPVFLEYLLECAEGIDDPAVRKTAQRSVRHTLDRMGIGGMNDQAGGGFHRYSVDAEWLVPHFEKMLYDNAQLASVYARSFGKSGDAFDALVCRRTLDYVLREMRDEAGGFYSAQDAEVDAREGLNYLWHPDEVRSAVSAALGEEAAAFAARVYGLDEPANFRDPHHPDEPARWILRLRKRPEALAGDLDMDAEAFAARLDEVNAALHAERGKRKQPGLDDKVIAAWNGMMMAGLADGAIALRDAAYRDAAKEAAEFVLKSMRDASGDLVRIWRRGEVNAGASGVLEDYAFMIQGLLAIHRANAALGDASPRYFAAAEELFARAERLFGDGDGVLHDTREGQGDLIVRTRSAYDGAIPAAATVMLHNAIDLFLVSRESGYMESAIKQLAGLSREIRRSPIATINGTRALYRLIALDPAILNALPSDSDEKGGSTTHDWDRDDPVAVLASADRVGVSAQKPGKVRLRIEIKPGYHINAHESGMGGLAGLRVEVVEGGGVEARVAYPPGVERGGEDGRPVVKVHHAQVEFDVDLRRTGEPWSGRPMLVLEYQACTDAACLPKRRVELDVAIDRAG